MESLIEPFQKLKQPLAAHQLRHAVEELSDRGMVQSATWAAELWCALTSESSDSPDSSNSSNALDTPKILDSLDKSSCALFQDQATSTNGRNATYRLAKSYFDCRQYRRTAHVLKNESTTIAQFLRGYALYLAGERRKEEERMELADWTEPDNLELADLRDELHALRDAGKLDAHLWYLYGIVQKRLKQNEKALEALVESVRLFPYNKGVWMELAPLCETWRVAGMLKVPNNWMRSIFLASILNDTEGSDQARQVFQAFATIVPRCRYAKLQLAISLYHMRLFDEAQQIFDEMYSQDEFCLDGVDIYSNILYVKEDKVNLSLLANKCIRIDKFRLETCCVIGNYYSLRGQHDQALSFFQRALRVNRNYLSAWTLMGHEFLEMKNTAAAVEAYRRAVDINPKDFRAWYGLGQTYELLNMPMYTLYYYQKAAALRPKDARMWCAVGQTLQELRKWDEALRCYERAVGCDDQEALALSKLASLYERLGRESLRDGRQHEKVKAYFDNAARYYEANLAKLDEEKIIGQQTADALRFLAEYHFTRGDVAKAREYGKRLVDCPGHDKDFVKTLLRQTHNKE